VDYRDVPEDSMRSSLSSLPSEDGLCSLSSLDVEHPPSPASFPITFHEGGLSSVRFLEPPSLTFAEGDQSGIWNALAGTDEIVFHWKNDRTVQL
jgi:hypothetical protein